MSGIEPTRRLPALLGSLEAGSDDFLPKPLRPPELIARLHGRLRLYELRQEAARRWCVGR